jgi:hypothetical protein
MPCFRSLIALALFAGVASAADTTKPAGDFARSGVAFLQKYCHNCHGATKPKADLSLLKYTNDGAVLADRKKWLRVLEMVQDGDMPPEGKPRPTADETTAFLKVVNGIFEKADSSAKPNPGRVTLRRLNKAEYNNTIRDLTLTDTNPAESFPSDDVGHGFDNIGDVLTLPPVLMERYLAAAEAVMAAAIAPVLPKPTPRGIGGMYLQPAGINGPLRNGRLRIVTVEGTPAQSGPIATTYDAPSVPSYGEYNYRVKLFAETESKKPVKVALLLNCKPDHPNIATEADLADLSGAGVKTLGSVVRLGTFEIKARTAKELQTIETKVPAGIGFTKAIVALVKPEPDDKPPTLLIDSILMDGPLDMRMPSHRMLLACEASKPKAEQTREVLERFVSRAYRRPATPDEVKRVVALVEAEEAAGKKWEAAIQHAMTAVLCSPKFLFRFELDDQPTSPNPHPIDEYQLASRLSYFLWSSMPDDELFELAKKKQLTANLDAQVKRMLQDPKSAALVDNFVMQWLQLRPLRNAQPDSKQFTTFNETLRQAMFEETRRFFDAIIKEDLSLLTILDADFTFMNPALAKHYGFLDTVGNKVGVKPKEKKPGGKPFARTDWQRVTLTGTERGGILSQASVLTVTSNPTRTSPVKRGRWVLEQLLGAPPPPPPPDVPELEKDGKPVSAGTLRQRMEVHRKNPACANCHAKMDPLGFGLENFDAVGAFRAKDGEFAIDSSGELPGGLKFNGPAELRKILLAKKDQFTRCLAEKMLTYAAGRGVEFHDKRAIDAIVEQTNRGESKFSALVTAIVKSDPFRMRPGKDQ